MFAQFTTRGIEALDWIAIDSLTAQKRMVQAGFGLALLQASAVTEELAKRELAVLEVDGLDVSVPVALVTRQGGYLSGGAQAVLRELTRRGR